MSETTAAVIARGRTRRKLRESPDWARMLRQRAALTQDEVAAVLGVSRVAVSRYESGERRPSGAVLDKYGELLDVLEASAR